MLFLNVENDRVLWMEKLERAVALIAFRDEIFAARIPMRIAPENRNFCADIMRRMELTAAQDVRGHGRGRRLAVHPGDDDAALPVHDPSEGFRAPDRRDPGR